MGDHTVITENLTEHTTLLIHKESSVLVSPTRHHFCGMVRGRIKTVPSFFAITLQL